MIVAVSRRLAGSSSAAKVIRARSEVGMSELSRVRAPRLFRVLVCCAGVFVLSVAGVIVLCRPSDVDSTGFQLVVGVPSLLAIGGLLRLPFIGLWVGADQILVRTWLGARSYARGDEARFSRRAYSGGLNYGGLSFAGLTSVLCVGAPGSEEEISWAIGPASSIRDRVSALNDLLHDEQ